MKNFFWILFLFSFSTQVSSSGISSRKLSYSEIAEKKVEYFEQLKENLDSFLGEIKYSIFLEFDYFSDIKKNGDSGSTLFLIGSDLRDDSFKNFQIVGARVKIIVYESLDNTLNEELKTIIKVTMSPYKILNIDVNYIESTRYISKQLGTGSKDATNFLRKLLMNHSKEIISLIGVVIISLIGLIGVNLLARLIQGPFATLADSFRSMARAQGSKSELPVRYENNDNENKPELDIIRLSEKFRENLNVFKEIVLTHPEQIKKFVVRSEYDACGIRKTLPYIYDKKYMDTLKKVLDKDDLEKLNCSLNKFENNSEYFEWFSCLVEEISIHSLGDVWSVVEKLPTEILKHLLKVSNNTLRDYACDKKSIIAYHIILDILKGKDRESFIQSLSVDEWKSVVTSSDIDVEEVQQIAEDILVYAREFQVGEGVVTARVIRDNVIIPSLLNIIPYKDLKTQDDFVESLSIISPHVMSEFRELYWTPRNILQVPGGHLNECLRDYDVEDKAVIIASLPLDVSEFIKSIIPEGKVKSIVEERIYNFDEESDKEDSHVKARSFIDRLFNDYKKQKFQLTAEILKFDRDENYGDDLLDEDLFNDFDDVG